MKMRFAVAVADEERPAAWPILSAVLMLKVASVAVFVKE